MVATPMSQILKGAARRRKTQDTNVYHFPGTAPQLTIGTQNVAQTSKALKKIPRIRALAQPQEMDVSVTISVGSDDISMDLIGKVEEFIDKECISGLCSIERGGGQCRLHLQMVCKLMASSVAMVSKTIKRYLGWDDPKQAPIGHHILARALRNTRLHTFVGMLGYCIKDKGQDHFQCVQRNVTDEQIAEGVEEYIKYGTPFAKNRIILTHKNLIERAATYCKYKMRKQLGSTLPGTLLPMLQFGQYIPSASWIVPVRQGRMEYNRALALWKCMINPEALEMQDVTQIFFEHTNPGSRLADLGQQRLAEELDNAQEGAAHDYVNISDLLERLQHDPNDVIVIHDTQKVGTPNADLCEINADEGLDAAPTYIPIVFRERDLENDFTI